MLSTEVCRDAVSVLPKTASAVAAVVNPPPVSLTSANEYPLPALVIVIALTPPESMDAVAVAPVPSPSI